MRQLKILQTLYCQCILFKHVFFSFVIFQLNNQKDSLSTNIIFDPLIEWFEIYF